MPTDPLTVHPTPSRKRRSAPDCASPYCPNRCDRPHRVTITQGTRTWELCGPECILDWLPLSLMASRYRDERAAIEAERERAEP